jgi:hypothetical protein
MHRHLLTVYLPLGSWAAWFGAKMLEVHGWVMAHGSELQNYSFLAALILSLCGLIGWAWKAIRKIRALFSDWFLDTTRK